MLKKLSIASLLLMSLVSTHHSIAAERDVTRSDFYNRMKAIMNEKPKTLLINSPEEYIYNLATTDFIKGLMNQYSGLTRIIASSPDPATLSDTNRELFLNIICAQSALGERGRYHYEVIEKLAIQDLDENQYNKNIKHLTSQSNNFFNLLEVPAIQKQCRKEGISAAKYSEAVNLIDNALK